MASNLSSSSSSDDPSSSSSSSEEEVSSELSRLHLEDDSEVIPANLTQLDSWADGANTNESYGSATNTKGSNKEYVLEKTYSNMIEAKKGIDAGEVGDQHWTRGPSYNTNEGSKVCFTCRRYPKCPKRMQLLLDPNSQDVLVSVSTDEHSHIAMGRLPALNPQSRAKVLELLESGVTKPRKILVQLESNGLPRISKVQINNLKSRIHLKASGPLTCTLSQFLQWVKLREDLPDNEDDVFVVAYDYKLSKTKKTKIKDLRCFMTTKRVIKNALKSLYALT